MLRASGATNDSAWPALGPTTSTSPGISHTTNGSPALPSRGEGESRRGATGGPGRSCLLRRICRNGAGSRPRVTAAEDGARTETRSSFMLQSIVRLVT
jgi:hypothetical protein